MAEQLCSYHAAGTGRALPVTMLTENERYVVAALRITRPAEPYGNGLAWICDVRAAVSHLMTPAVVDETLMRLQGRETEPGSGERVVLRRADMVDGVFELVVASGLQSLTECWHYAGLVRQTEVA